MDDALRDLERAVLRDPADRGARRTFLLALARAGELASAWRAARERGDPVLADALFELAQAPFTLEVVAWPHEATPLPVRVARLRSSAYVGRMKDVELPLPSPWLARRHTQVLHRGGHRFELLDMGSANGTWHDEVRVTACDLQDRGRFSPGSPEIVIEFRLGWDGEPWPAPPAALLDRLLV